MAKYLLVPLAIAAALTVLPVYGQVASPCGGSLLSSFTPCMNLLSNSSYNGSAPTADCCNSLKSLTSGGLDCLCLFGTANLPFKLPINRSLAISLPHACKMPGVPLQCKAAAAPAPVAGAPGPVSLGPALSPQASLTPQASVAPEAQAPAADKTPTLSPPTTIGGAGAPTATASGSRSVLNPQASSAVPTFSLSLAPLVSTLAFLVLMYFYSFSSF